MNTDLASGVELADAVLAALAAAGVEESVEAAVYPPFPYLFTVGRTNGFT